MHTDCVHVLNLATLPLCPVLDLKRAVSVGLCGNPNCSARKELLDWKPRIMLKDGLARAITYFDKLLSDQNLRAVHCGAVGLSKSAILLLRHSARI